MEPKVHWQQVYRTKKPTEVSWYQATTPVSLRLMHRVAPDRSAAIIDVGAGASTLVDRLLSEGYYNVTVLDVSSEALAGSAKRLGENAARVQWLEADLLRTTLPVAAYDVWHDRALFHFLTGVADRKRYVSQVLSAVKVDGHVIVATFATDGPMKCSGLEVARYTPEGLHAELGHNFEVVESVREEHRTPAGMTQPFTYCLFRLKAVGT